MCFQPSTQLEEKSGKMSGINVEEYLKEDDDLMVFAGVTEEDIMSEIIDEMENDYDKVDADPLQSLLTSQDVLQSVQSLQAFFSQAFHPQMIIIFVHRLYANLLS
ncbi:hypothetical protein AVEN_247352-1 [Araneus ventricosus]|uniref:Uncharacterized protein n=1 Tax=Araneus ventricosus TaxID=182803 RepID=A0A4Y2T439_ARAVE|nr:hypothetical protein AVEN_247352-1 [Araneus ventricosus]